ncbi:MAG: hypothetical protein FJX02_12270 [Alphaproteobacteria bacterium]|nr:hypothetical protein [Alphaproteobacteria bacterium]
MPDRTPQERQRPRPARVPQARLQAVTLAVALSVLGASPAVAQSVCGLTATAMAFGNYSAVLGTAGNTTATLTMTCTNNTNAADTVNYSISLATGVGGGYNPRAWRPAPSASTTTSFATTRGPKSGATALAAPRS